jgi:uncharacterized protein YkwD
MSPFRRIAPLALLCGAFVIASPAVASACTGTDLPSADQTEAQLEDTVLCLINEQRASARRPPVRTNSKLRAAALRHSSDMVSQGFFAHTTPAGVDFIDRIRQAGYVNRSRAWLVGENLVWGAGSRSTPGALVEGWMQSPAHRDNLLRKRFREIGIAAVSGTPSDASNADGITVSSEYGYRGKRRKK